MIERVDVFISYDSRDKDVVQQIVDRLRVHGLSAWIDNEQIHPGRSFLGEIEKVIAAAGSALVAIGTHGLGGWEKEEADACVRECVNRRLPVIPVLLPGGPAPEALPAFLGNRHAVDLRHGITDEGIRLLVRGITGTALTETTRGVVIELSTRDEGPRVRQFVDAWGTASVRSQLHAVSEVVAQAAADEAAAASVTIDDQALSMLVPLAVELRWRRGYLKALDQMLRLSRCRRRLDDSSCREVEGGCAVAEGVLSAAMSEQGAVVISLDGHPAVVVTPANADEAEVVMASANAHGRLGAEGAGRRTLLERIGAVELRRATELRDEESMAFIRNREALAALLARKGMAGCDWLFGEAAAHGELPAAEPPSPSITREELLARGGVEEEEFDARDVRMSPEEIARIRRRNQYRWR